MTTQQIFQPCQPSDLSPQSESFSLIMRQARRAGAFAALAIVIAAIPVATRLLAFADIPALSFAGIALMVPGLAVAGLITSRWASCSFVKEEELRLTTGAARTDSNAAQPAE